MYWTPPIAETGYIYHKKDGGAMYYAFTITISFTKLKIVIYKIMKTECGFWEINIIIKQKLISLFTYYRKECS